MFLAENHWRANGHARSPAARKLCGRGLVPQGHIPVTHTNLLRHISGELQGKLVPHLQPFDIMPDPFDYFFLVLGL